MPGAPLPPGTPVHVPPPPPPNPFTDFAPPAPPEPSIQYTNASPTEAAAARFGGYAGPADPFAPPQPQPQPQPSPFGGAPVPYGTPTWSTAPPKRKGSRLWVTIVAGVLAVVVGGVVLLHLVINATRHHVTTLPPSLNGTTLDTSSQMQALAAEVTANEEASNRLHHVSNFQIGIYRDGATNVIVDMGDIPPNSPAFRTTLLNQQLTSQGVTPTSVTPGRQGGSESCGTMDDGVLCEWADNGTLGTVLVEGGDLPTAEIDLQALRDQVEH